MATIASTPRTAARPSSGRRQRSASSTRSRTWAAVAAIVTAGWMPDREGADTERGEIAADRVHHGAMDRNGRRRGALAVALLSVSALVVAWWRGIVLPRRPA